DLERIGDLAANIAKRARRIAKEPAVTVPSELDQTALKARDMVRNSLTAFVNLDAELANEVREADDEVDDLCKEVFVFVTDEGKKNPDQLKIYLSMLLASRNLERIGDHATNIAEDIVYLVDGVIVRHRAVDEED
ncbi:MAG TPA: PhoU domain-containing protein, partial [Tichowtungia sp.]|nr:PhoU domain-containing protein [Tichowtungia sp.]